MTTHHLRTDRQSKDGRARIARQFRRTVSHGRSVIEGRDADGTTDDE